MRLSKMKMAGFKSFVDPTTISFPSDLVGVVGPNGCGKSNIIDAARWVMGESSRHLRGDNMEDVIFNGSSARKPVGQASIELIFDNSDGKAGGQYAQYSELALRRTLSRDGQSKYFLNGSLCRRRDVIDIFLGTGLGPRSYAIIEQGTISRLIEARPEDLRVYLEEAAGISKYKERRRETENRMRHARENISRLDDLRGEIGKQLNHLQRQAKTAERYQSLKQEERKTKASMLALRLRRQERDAALRERVINELQTRQEQTTAELRRAEAELEKLRLRQSEASDSLNVVQAGFYQLGGDISRTEQSIQHHRALRDRQQQELGQARQATTSVEAEVAKEHERLTRLTAEIAELAPLLEQREAELASNGVRLAEAEEAMAQCQSQWEHLTIRAADPERIVQVERARIEQLERHQAQLTERQVRLAEEQQQLPQTGLTSEIEQLREQVAQTRALAEASQSELREVLTFIAERREHDKHLTQRLAETRERAQQVSGRLSALEALQEAAVGKHEQAVAQWLARNGLHQAPRLAERLVVRPGWERALETVLGPALEALCVGDLDAAIEAMDELTHGRLYMLHVAARAPVSPPPAEPLPTLATEALIESSVLPRAIRDLLAQVFVAADLTQALEIRERLGEVESVVTADGIWLGLDWLRVTREDDAYSGVLVREAEIKTLRAELEDLQRAVDHLRAQAAQDQMVLEDKEQAREQLQVQGNEAHRSLVDVEGRLRQQEHQLERIAARRAQIEGEQGELHGQQEHDQAELSLCAERHAQALESIKFLVGEKEALATSRARAQQALGDARTASRQSQEQAHQLALRLEALRTAHIAAQEGLARTQAQNAQLGQRQLELEAAIAQGAEPLQRLEQELECLLRQRLDVERAMTVARAGMQEIEAALREQDQHRMRAERRLEDLRAEVDVERMAWRDASVRAQTLGEQVQETGFQLDAIIAELEVAADGELGVESPIEQWEAQVENLRLRIERLGPINLAAIDEYREQSQRKEYLDRQHADLTEALTTLEDAIHRIDRETRQRFRETFDRVNARLQTTFPRLFGGGQAHLEVTDSDWLTTGIAIMARPPGKRLSTIHLMSGGEKALTAVALVFALFELNPAPFCLLDEVDAPLDDANVGRFCELVKEMSLEVQFIFITHNKSSMESADHLIGVTMHEPGVSRLVAVDVEEAALMATG